MFARSIRIPYLTCAYSCDSFTICPICSIRPQPLFLHKLTNEGARVCFAPELDAIDTTLVELLDLPRKCTFDLVRVDPAVMPLMGLREEPLVSPAVAPHVFAHAAAAQARFAAAVIYGPDCFHQSNSRVCLHSSCISTHAHETFSGRVLALLPYHTVLKEESGKYHLNHLYYFVAYFWLYSAAAARRSVCAPSFAPTWSVR